MIAMPKPVYRWGRRASSRLCLDTRQGAGDPSISPVTVVNKPLDETLYLVY